MHEAVLVGKDDGLHAVSQVQLREDVCDVRLHRGLRDDECVGNLCVRLPLRKPLAASLLIPIDIAVAWTPDEVRNAVMGTYLAASYGLLGLGLIRQASQLGTHESAASRTVRS